MIALIIIIVSIVVAYVLYNKNKKSVSKSKNTRRISNKSTLPKIYVSKTSQRKRAPTYSVTKTSNSVGTHAREVASVGTPSAGKDVGTGTRPVDVGTGTRPVDVGTIPDREPKNASASVGVQTTAPVEPVQPPPSAPDIIDVDKLPSLDTLLMFADDVILKTPTNFENKLNSIISQDNDLSPIIQQITGRLSSVSVDTNNIVNFGSKLSPLKDVPDERINQARKQFNTDAHMNDIKQSLEDFKQNKNLQNYKSVLQSVLKYVEDYINIFIEPEMTVRSIVNIYTPSDRAKSKNLSVENNNITLDEKKYGPFKQIIESGGKNSSNPYDVSFDSGQIQTNRQMIYAGYGYSGSGKTYTLLNTTDGVLKRLLDESSFTFDDLTFEFVEIYGESNRDEIREKITYYSYERQNGRDRPDIKQSEKSIITEFSNIEDLNIFIDELNIYRADWKNYEKGKPRIRHTPNNPNSSRAHLIINVRRRSESNQKLFSILDMGGSEDVDAIQKLYYNKIVVPGSSEYIKKLDAAIVEIKKIHQSQIGTVKLGYIIKNDYRLRPIEEEAINLTEKFDTFNAFIQSDYSDEETEHIIKDSWKEVLTKYKPEDDDNLQHINMFLNENTFDTIRVYHILSSIFNIKLDHSNLFKKSLVTVLMLNRVIHSVNEMENLQLPLLNPIKSDIKDAQTNDLIKDATLSSLNKYLEIPETYSAFYAKNTSKWKQSGSNQENLILTLILGQDDAEIKNFKNFIQYLQKFPGSIVEKYEKFKNQIIQTYHKPLREQGNYINESIVEFQKLSKDIKRKKLSESNGRIFNTLRKTLQLDETTIQDSKLVIFTCMRMGHDDETLQRSLQFAHCINPFKLEADGYFKCSRDSRRLLSNLIGRHKDEGQYTAYLDDDTALLLVILFEIDIFILDDNDNINDIVPIPIGQTDNKQFILIKRTKRGAYEHYESLTYNGIRVFEYDRDNNNLQEYLKQIKETFTFDTNDSEAAGSRQQKIRQIFDMMETVETIGYGTCLLHAYLYLTNDEYFKQQNEKDKIVIASDFRRKLHKKLSEEVQLQDRFDSWTSNRFNPVFKFQKGSGSPQIALSKRSVESLQRLGMFNLVKAIRYKYYEQNRSKFQHDVLLTDRIATLALTIVLLALTEDAVALGVMFDQIVCTSLLNYKNDRKMLLLPVYLPFI